MSLLDTILNKNSFYHEYNPEYNKIWWICVQNLKKSYLERIYQIKGKFDGKIIIPSDNARHYFIEDTLAKLWPEIKSMRLRSLVWLISFLIATSAVGALLYVLFYVLKPSDLDYPAFNIVLYASMIPTLLTGVMLCASSVDITPSVSDFSALNKNIRLIAVSSSHFGIAECGEDGKFVLNYIDVEDLKAIVCDAPKDAVHIFSTRASDKTMFIKPIEEFGLSMNDFLDAIQPLLSARTDVIIA